MKYSVVATVAALAATVSAQVDIPSCAVTCIGSTSDTGCGTSDFACLCQNKDKFVGAAEACICKSCDKQADVQAAYNLANNVCLQYLSSALPEPTCLSHSAGSSSAPASAPASASSSQGPAVTSTAALTTSTSQVVFTSTSSIAVVVPPTNHTASATGSTSTTPTPPPAPSSGAGSVAASGALAIFGVVAAFIL